jgi:hypothetical protein
LDFFALSYGIILAFFFASGNQYMPSRMILGLLPLSFFFPIYRTECLLGIVLGMTNTFGAVHSTGIAKFFVLINVGIYLFLRQGQRYVHSIWIFG